MIEILFQKLSLYQYRDQRHLINEPTKGES